MKSISKKETIIILVAGVGGILLIGFSLATTGGGFPTHPAVLFTGFISGAGGGTLACLYFRFMKK